MTISFKKVERDEFRDFVTDVQDVFSIAVLEEFGETDDTEVIPDADVEEALYDSYAEVYYIYVGEEKIGGIALHIDSETHHNSLELFYIYPKWHSKGFGTNIWKMVEQKYPETQVWEVITPYFEKRNINFYVNKCGFHIVEFFSQYHKCPGTENSDKGYEEEYFRFEKRVSETRSEMFL